MKKTIEELKDEIETLKTQRNNWKNLHDIAEDRIITLTNNSTVLALRYDKIQKELERMRERLKRR